MKPLAFPAVATSKEVPFATLRTPPSPLRTVYSPITERSAQIAADKRNVTLVKVVDLGPGVFQGAKNETMLLFFVSGSARSDAVVDVFRTNPKLFPEHTQYFAPRQQDWVNKDGTPWLVHGSDESAKFMNSMRRAKHKLGDLTTINQGLRTGDNDN